jgi:hypothetical protein
MRMPNEALLQPAPVFGSGLLAALAAAIVDDAPQQNWALSSDLPSSNDW